MPSIEENLYWGRAYAWPQGGDEWSEAWGNPDSEWHSTILPRIRRHLPAKTVLEIAPGFGRWSQYLIRACDSYVGIDLNPQCIEACTNRFSNTGAKFFVNDGRSLDAVADKSVEFAFSFDSLVHVEIDVLTSYFEALSNKLTPNGVAFLHHSNLGEYDASVKLCQSLSKLLRNSIAGKIAHKLQITGWDQFRGNSVTATNVNEAATKSGLACISQEIIPWNGGLMIDCITQLTPQGSTFERPNIVIRNHCFMKEAFSARAASKLYG
jgi:hypothetical protein